MIERTISIRYARALMALAIENGKVEDFGQQIKDFAKLCVEHQDLMYALSHSGFGHVNRLSVLSQVLVKTDLDIVVQNFLKLLVTKGRVDLIPLIVEQYQVLSNKNLGREPMKVVSAVALPDEQYNELVQYFGEKLGKKMILSKKIDPEVLGGVKVQIEDKIYDYTLSQQLADLSERMMA